MELVIRGFRFKIKLSLILVLVTILFVDDDSFCQQVRLGVGAGLSKQYGIDGNFFEPGKEIGAYILFTLTPDAYFGLYASWAKWNPIDGNSLMTLDSRYDWETFGQGEIIEFSPKLMLASNPLAANRLRFYVQLGIGYYLVNNNIEYHDWDAALLPNQDDPSVGHEYLVHDSNRFGTSIGCGVLIKMTEKAFIEVAPSYRMISYEPESFKYASVNISVGMIFERKNASK